MVLNIQIFHLFRSMTERFKYFVAARSKVLKNSTDLITRPAGGYRRVRTHTGAETHLQPVNCYAASQLE